MVVREEGVTTVLEPRPLPHFVETKFVKEITDRALAYIRAGFPVHFRGASGTGKTTLAMHVAGRIGRPVVMIHGDEEFSTSDLVGGEYGYHMRKVIDNFIHSVLKTEEDMTRQWMDNRLTVACKYGFARGDGENYLKVDPEFTAIFTSNPEEYAGVYRSQDALRDRMVTLDLDHFDEETEVAITAAKSGLGRRDAAKIVRVVRALRESGACEYAPTIRGPIMIAKTLKVLQGSVDAGNQGFRSLCLDILASETSRVGSKAHSAKVRELVGKLVDQHC
jgi:MoxR-like ATPase